MTIKEQLDGLLRNAVLENDVPVKNVVRSLRAQAEQKFLSQNLPLYTDDDSVYLGVISTYSRSIDKALKSFEKGGRGDSDLATEYRFEVDFCSRFLPKQKTEGEVEEIVKGAVSELKANKSQTGDVIRHVLQKYAGSVTPSIVSRIVKQILS
jgi:uncharacterized protein YqeY